MVFKGAILILKFLANFCFILDFTVIECFDDFILFFFKRESSFLNRAILRKLSLTTPCFTPANIVNTVGLELICSTEFKNCRKYSIHSRSFSSDTF